MTDKVLPEKVFFAARQITKLLFEAYIGERGVHAETVICAGAALVGEFCLRATGAPLPTEGWVVGDAVNQVMFEGDLAPWQIIVGGAVQAGLDETNVPHPRAAIARTAVAIGGSPYPAMSVSEEHYPSEWSPLACPRFRDDIEKIHEDAQLTPHGTCQRL